MFLLFVDADRPSKADQFSLFVRELFIGVFEEIGEAALVDNIAQLEDIIKETSESDDCLVVPFGEKSAAQTPSNYYCLPILFSPVSASIADAENVSAAFQLDGAEGLKGKIHSLNWPLWNAPAISSLRGHSPHAEKKIFLSHHAVLADTHAGPEQMHAQGVVFATGVDADAPSKRLNNLIAEFVAAFRHNEDAILRIHIHDLFASGANPSALAKRIGREIDEAGPMACRIIVVDAAGAPQNPSRVFDMASFYIASDDLSDQFIAAGYFSAQIPVIIPYMSVPSFGLYAHYPLATDAEKSLCVVLKNAFHIARTAPNGYRQLRRAAMDISRERFSHQSAIERIRMVFYKPKFAQKAPNIDTQRLFGTNVIENIGLYDYVKSGWLDHSTHMLAPGFRIDKEDIVVDVGCGKGGFSRFCSAFAREVVFCDLNAESLQKAEDHIREAARCPIRGLLTTGEALEIDDHYADKIICTEVLEHVEDPEKVMSELFRIGKPGSLYLISVPDTINERLQKELAPPEYFEKPNHIRIFERDEFSKLVANSGLKILNREFYGFYHVFFWVIFWFADPALDFKWAQLWKHILDHEKGPETKAALDRYIAKSQSIIARKPQSYDAGSNGAT
jgi:2-polyprenyl-3-methyl-5-hydroxy-6-metoxy-1,4-benzoquinol methylase